MNNPIILVDNQTLKQILPFGFTSTSPFPARKLRRSMLKSQRANNRRVTPGRIRQTIFLKNGKIRIIMHNSKTH